MEQFEGRIAVITGGGTGMGRELAVQLATEGCHLALCDLSEEAMAKTRQRCDADAPAGTRVSTFVADVSDESALEAFRDHTLEAHGTDHVHLLFNNAGIAGAGSFVNDEREEWEKTFDVCWKGVYGGCRVFLPLLMKASEGHVINTSSVNGFWASLGPNSAHTSYSAAKFAVKGFTEALINDFRLNAPHLKVSLVMPGHIGTDIVNNSNRFFGRDPKELSSEQLAEARERMGTLGFEVEAVSDDQIRQGLQMIADGFRDGAPMTAAEAAKIILDGVREGRWRILVGKDAVALDEMVRADPENAYEASFSETFTTRSGWQLGDLAERAS
jgi:NAD(P)-dependent dehydrogenase (short-subunit alcohol dehydrogenase family)